MDLKTVLGAEGRVVLTSSTSIQYSFEQPDGDLSIYTRYLIEGIRTGAADLDNDGAITVDELHKFASRKVQEESPAMNPQIIVLKEEGYRIRLANVALGDPKVKYRKEIEAIVLENEGEIDELLDRPYLDELRESLAIAIKEAEAIEHEVLEPIRQRHVKMARYLNVFLQAVQRCYPLRDSDLRKLERLQKILGLQDEDVLAIKTTTVGRDLLEQVIERSQQINEKGQLENDLRSEKGMDYKPLRDMLKAGQWQEADQETWRVMCAVMERSEEGWLTVEDIQQFPCTDLKTIDQLWVKYSNGRFGFSVQKQIYGETGNPLDGQYHEKEFAKFGERVGWRKKGKWLSYSDITFSTSTSKAHLPITRRWGWVGGLGQRVASLLSRRDL